MKVYKHADAREISFLFDNEDNWSYLCLHYKNNSAEKDKLYAGYLDRDYYNSNPPDRFQLSSWLELLVLTGISKAQIEKMYGLDAIELVKQLRLKREGVHG